MYSKDQKVMELQKEILVLLKKFHKICVNNNIKYTLHGGSMLGAVREGGFIPWDDDADIALVRSEYTKLVKVFKENTDPEIYLDNYSDKMYKVWMQREGKTKVWIDIFVYDYISSFKPAQKMKLWGIMLLTPFVKNEISMKQFRVNGRANKIQRIIYEAIYFIGKHFPLQRRIKLIEWFEKKMFLGDKSLIHRSNDQLFAIKMIIKSEYMTNYIEIEFEDTKLMVTQNYDEVLTSSYGSDYMVPRKVSDDEKKVHDIARNDY